jgi:hypothetical protein
LTNPPSKNPEQEHRDIRTRKTPPWGICANLRNLRIRIAKVVYFRENLGAHRTDFHGTVCIRVIRAIRVLSYDFSPDQ